jgi:hypothetical protein
MSPSSPATLAVDSNNPPPRLLDQLRQAALSQGFALASVEKQVAWARRFILFHGKRHPKEMSTPEIGQFLEHVAQTERDPLRSLSAARDALLFL